MVNIQNCTQISCAWEERWRESWQLSWNRGFQAGCTHPTSPPPQSLPYSGHFQHLRRHCLRHRSERRRRKRGAARSVNRQVGETDLRGGERRLYDVVRVTSFDFSGDCKDWMMRVDWNRPWWRDWASVRRRTFLLWHSFSCGSYIIMKSGRYSNYFVVK